eukprot:TRINITY_DN13399_c0_g1_i1.p1 TRINITY_DN13399_c0_g1~~TRINITY_DN13399_c0_g1_i1.p1  ORF type:complete len:371 (+),score=88.90 TRINITY_DN13399_c0_g1_i1:125-1237(+)
MEKEEEMASRQADSYTNRKYHTWAEMEAEQGPPAEHTLPLEDLSGSESDLSEYEYDPDNYYYYYETVQPKRAPPQKHRPARTPNPFDSSDDEDEDEDEEEDAEAALSTQEREKKNKKKREHHDRFQMKVLSYQIIIGFVLTNFAANTVVYFLFTQFWEGYWKVGGTSFILGVQFLTMLLYSAAMSSNPGFVKTPRHAVPSAEDEQHKDYCSDCKMIRPPRAFHCVHCQRCVHKLDHHSPVINNCIGKSNARLFVLFVAMLGLNIIGIAAMLICDIPWITGHPMAEPHYLVGVWRPVWLYCVLVLVAVPWGFSILAVLGRYITLVCIGISIHEQKNFKDLEYLSSRPFRNTYSKGVIGNCIAFWRGLDGTE